MLDAGKRTGKDGYHASPVAGLLGEIPALTGLRFCAAAFVFLGHASQVIRFTPSPNIALYAFGQTTAFGMSLFFVLSGFVIHYNYVELVHPMTFRGIAKFLVARFARLYPLYLLIVVADLAMRRTPTDFPAAIYYFGLVQSWVYLLYGDLSLIRHLQIAQVTWSISTEWFFYLCYPAIALLVLRAGLRTLIIVTLCYMALLSCWYLFPSAINAAALSLWGPAATENPGSAFLGTMIGFSPFGRMHEFLTGVVAAQVFINRSNAPPKPKENRAGLALLAIALAAIALMYWSLQVPTFKSYVSILAASTMVLIPASVGCLVFCCSRYRSWLSAAVSAWPFILCGEASYSIYLFHMAGLERIAVADPLPLTVQTIATVTFRVGVVAILVLMLAITSYRLFEMPCRRAIRSGLADVSAVKAKTIIASLAGIPSGLAVYGWAVSFGVR